jgi:hypothetical protein
MPEFLPQQTVFQPPAESSGACLANRDMTNGNYHSPYSSPRDPHMLSSNNNSHMNRDNSGNTEPMNFQASSQVRYVALSDDLGGSNNSAPEHSDSSSSHPSERSLRDSTFLVNSPMSTSDDEDLDPYVRLAKRTVRGRICEESPKQRLIPAPIHPLDDAYNEYLRCVPISPRSETQTDPFTSSDPLENRDNSPTRWGRVRGLRDDEERKAFAREQFGNLESANPAQNLTYHGFRRTVMAEDLEIRFRPHGDYYSSNFVHVVDGVLEYTDPSRYV